MPTRSIATILFISLLSVVVLASSAPRQALDVRFDPDERTLEGTLDVTMHAASGTVYFALFANLGREANPYLSARTQDGRYPFGFEESSLEVESVGFVQSPSVTPLRFRWLSMPPALQTYSLEETILAVDLDREVQTPTLRIRFTAHAPRTSSGDDGVTDEILTWRFGWYPLLVDDQAAAFERDGVLHVGELGAFPLVFPRVEMEATFAVPAGYQLFCGADHVDVESAEDEPTVYRTSFDAPTHSLAITIAEDYEVYRLDGPTPIEVAYFPGREEEGRLFATYARDILAHYESRFGPYPRHRLTIVQNPNRDGSAFAADGIVWLSSLYFTHRDIPLGGVLNRFLEYVLAHEIAHQWMGMGTELDLDEDAWLSEGLAQYASISYFESRHGAFDGNLFDVVPPGFFEEIVDRQFGFMNLREHQTELPYLVTLWSGFDEALVKPAREVEYANADVARLYDKGYLVARAIAATVGEETFDRALRASIEETHDRRLDAPTLLEFVEAEAGRSLDEVFSAWVYGNVHADYSVEIRSRQKTATGYETRVAVRREGGIPQPVEVEATLSTEATTRQTWDGATPEDTIVFYTPSRVVRVTIDPEHRLPDENRLNNNDPVKVVTAVQRAAFPLDAYLISPSADSTGFSFSWLDRFKITVQGTSATMVVREDRSRSYAGSVSVEGQRLTGAIEYSYTDYEPLEAGSPSTYWVESGVLTARARRFLAGEETMWSVGLSAIDLPTFADSGARAVALDVAENASLRLALSIYDEVRLLPRFYLEGVGSVGFGVGDLPEPMLFDFDELRSSSLSAKPNKLSGRISVELTGADTPYNLANLAMVDGYRTRLFVAGGLGWTTFDPFGTTPPSVEAGVEQVLELSTLGGLLPFAVQVGIATPISGPGETVVYVGVSF
jgi:hypothetical protein